MDKEKLLEALFVKKGLILEKIDLKKVIPLGGGEYLLFFVYFCHTGEKICLGFICESKKIKKEKKELFFEKVYEKEGDKIPSKFSIDLIENLETI